MIRKIEYIYDNVIAPYKGELEEWYVNHQDYILILVIGYYLGVLFPDSKLYELL